MLSYTTLDERSIQLLLTHFHEFLRYLQSNSGNLFNLQQDYKDPPLDYHRKFQQLWIDRSGNNELQYVFSITKTANGSVTRSKYRDLFLYF